MECVVECVMEVLGTNLFLHISLYRKVFTCLEKAMWNLLVVFHTHKMKHSL